MWSESVFGECGFNVPMCELNCVTLCQILQHFGLGEGQMQLKCVIAG